MRFINISRRNGDGLGSCRRQSPRDENTRAITDHAPNLSRREFAPAKTVQHHVKCGGQIWQAVNERAVEIKD